MKRVLFFLLVSAVSLTAAQSQNLKAGISASLPIGDVSEAYSFGLQADLAYLFNIAESIQVGPMAGLIYYNGDKIKDEGESFKIDEPIFLPVGGHARFSLDQFFIGADLGYAIGLAPSGMNGGLLIRPKVGYNFGGLAAVASYSAITRNGTFGSINLGVEFSF